MTRKAIVVGALLLIGAAGCADLEVVNPNDPDRGRALKTAGDVEALIGGAFSTWWNVTQNYNGQAFTLSVASFQHSASWNNACMVPCSTIPRQPLVNDQALADPYAVISNAWGWSYQALAAVGDGMRAIEENEDFANALGAEGVQRARAFARFVQGLAHGSVALLYDKGFIVDETTDVTNLGEPLPYDQIMTAALGYLDQAISLSEGASFSIPSNWVSQDMTAADLALVAHSFKAQFRAAVARNPDERENVDWDAVMADIDAGIQTDWGVMVDWNRWYHDLVEWHTFAGYGWIDYFIYGMADQSGDYQTWLSTPVTDRKPVLGSDSILIQTPDLRFPQGATVSEQEASPGTLFEIPTGPTSVTKMGNIAEQWQKPDRGTWRWSWYRATDFDANYYGKPAGGLVPLISADGMRLLKAEALLRKGQAAQAATLINVTREAAGLNATDASGTNTSCVPRLPDTSCGDLFEMLKWEKRLETRLKGTLGTPWFYDSRGWGDLYYGTMIELPMPCGDLSILQTPCYNTGGGEQSSAPASSYAFPFEGT